MTEKMYYTINEVCDILDLKPHIIRYWQTEFTQLKSKRKHYKTRYSPAEVELLKQIKELIVTRKFTLIGAKKEMKSPVTAVVCEVNTNDKSSLKKELLEIRELLKRSVESC